ncbi:MAG: glycosyltransferase family 4 protein [Armatimonadetes bacterium]|nr:glycosyltransferase family 4 protein [Armatimonadota bacterium]
MKKSVVLVNHEMGMGGAERQFSIMANNLAGRGWDVGIATWVDEPSYYELAPGVEHIRMGASEHGKNALQGLVLNRERIRRLRAVLAERKPSVVISFNHRNNIRSILAARPLGIPTIVMEASDPFREPLEREWKILRTLLYPTCASVVLQTQAVVSYFRPNVQRIVEVIPNPIVDPGFRRKPNPSGRSVVSLGRLVEVKGQDLLLKAFSLASKQKPDWRLTLYGEGESREELEAIRSELKLEKVVDLPGAVAKPYEVLAKADLFVMSSRREGFPNALCEAMAVGLPAVSFDCPYGPGFIIREGVDGLLAKPEDVEDLAAKLVELMSDDERREAMSVRAPEVLDRFGEQKVMDQWEALLNKVAK